MSCNGLKKGSFHLFVHPKWSRIIFGKTHFDPFLVAKQPIFKAFWGFRRAHSVASAGPPFQNLQFRAKISLFSAQNRPRTC